MARTHHQQYLFALKSANEHLTNLFLTLAARVRDVLLREALPDGSVPRTRATAIRDEVGQMVTRLFLVPAGGEPVPYTMFAGRVIPQSPFMTALWTGIEEVTRIGVEQQAFYIQRALSDAPDVIKALHNAQVNPFSRARQVAEFTGFSPRPFVSYDPAHRFVDPRGYTLSMNIWKASTETRRKLDGFLAEAIAEGRGALSIAGELELFLHPDRVIARTNKPYGTNASYDAMRLARTEITAAHMRAGLMSARMNPFVDGVEIVLSPAHGCCDICDYHVSGNPYTLDNVPNIPGDTHPHCMCHYRWLMASNVNDIIDQLRGMIGQPPTATATPFVLLIGPLLVERFARFLLDDPVEEVVA